MESKEKISIKNFAGIEELEMDIKPINILIGPQGVGKSVVVKLIYFFRSIMNEVISDNIYDILEKKVRLKKTFLLIFDSSVFEDNFEVKYIDEFGFKYVVRGDLSRNLEIEFSDEFSDFLDEFKSVKEYLESRNTSDNIKELYSQKLEQRFILHEFYSAKLNTSVISQIFIPAGRSFFSTVDKAIYSIMDSDGRVDKTLDYFMLRFGSLYRVQGELYDLYRYTSAENVKCDYLIKEIIGGTYLHEDSGKDYILHSDSRKVELKNVSSGQQEALPLLLILKGICEKYWKEEGSTLYIEEPEAHLFPTAQKAIVELLAKTYNSNSENTKLFITTHSPYILTSFNNLIYAGNIIKQDESKRDAVEKVIDRETLLDWSQVGAYAVTKEGIKDLIDQENHIINAELLDEVSNQIGREFDQLLDIEYAE